MEMDHIDEHLRFVIYAPCFNENSGGAIALHRLCHLLRKQGFDAYLWPMGRPSPLLTPWYYRAFKGAHHIVQKLISGNYNYNGFDTPIAPIDSLEGSIVVYPEIVCGDPLRVGRCVRWLLHQPGYLTSQTGFGEGDLMFYYQDAFRSDKHDLIDGGLLQTLWVRDDIYHADRERVREGVCYMDRKVSPAIPRHDSSAQCLDGLSHAEIAREFQLRETFISYDPYTMYSHYAAVCGCDSVVIPPDGMSKDQWYSEEQKRYGIAFGFEEIEWARATQKKALDFLKNEELDAIKSVDRFAELCMEQFGSLT